MKRREQKEEDKVTLEELEKQRVEALKLVKKEREIVEQERAVYESIADKISKRHTSHNIDRSIFWYFTIMKTLEAFVRKSWQIAFSDPIFHAEFKYAVCQSS